jgi:pimeloyl-ACP methyl ester carboxylesterase
LADFKLLTKATNPGDLAAYLALPFGNHGPDYPLVVFLHGAGRKAGVFQPWRELLLGKADVCLIDFPGHGLSLALLPASIDLMAEAVDRLLRAHFSSRRILIVGESFGGLVAMKLADGAADNPVKAILAADPPFTTAKQWAIINSFRAKFTREPEDTFFFSFAEEIFGITPKSVSERIYYPLLADLQVPTMLVTGDLPMLPPRVIKSVACLNDPVDQFVIDNLYPGKVMRRSIANSGHLMLTESLPASLALVEEMLPYLAARSD